MVNFLFDRAQNPHISANELYEWFGIAASTGQGKSKLVRDTLKMRQFDPDWCLPSRGQWRLTAQFDPSGVNKSTPYPRNFPLTRWLVFFRRFTRF
jgi:Domain of unknown function (DUF6398)